MAIKDLSNTYFPADFMVLINQLGLYLQAAAKKSAGPPPAKSKTDKGSSSSVMITYNREGELAGILLIAFWRTNVVPLDPKVSINSKGTFDKKFNDIATWDNYFFVLRTQLIGAVGNNDPLVKDMDVVWVHILQIKGTWKEINQKKRF